MKRIVALELLVAGFALWVSSHQRANAALPREDDSPSSLQVTERGADYRVLSTVMWHTNLQGLARAQTNALYTELATGMHYFSRGHWKESSPNFTIEKTGYAVANESQHPLRVAPNLNTTDAVVDLTLPNGRHLRSAIVGLNLFDPASGQSQQIAAVKDSVGQLTAPNEVTFFDAFVGVSADLRIRNELGSFHQEVLLREKLTANQIAELGFDANSARLETWTEFIEAPAPKVQSLVIPTKHEGVHQAKALGSEVVDQSLDFAGFEMVQGRSFIDGKEHDSTPVYKEWMKIEGKTYLVEAAECANLARLANRLPTRTNAALGVKTSSRLLAKRSPPIRSHQLIEQGIEVAKVEQTKVSSANPPVVLDYVGIFTTQTNFTFKGDTTYYITNSVYLYGTTVFEGGAVLKFGQSGGVGRGALTIYGTNIECRTAPYRPVVFTAKDDNSVGEAINGSTRNPNVGHYGDGAGALSLTFSCTLTNFRFSYLSTAVSLGSSGNFAIYDGQFVSCSVAITQPGETVALGIYNGLFCNGSCFYFPLSTDGPRLTCQNITAYNCGLTGVPDGYSLDENYNVNDVSIVNGLLINTSTGGSVSTNHCAFVSSGTGVLQSVGGAAYYLADNTYRDAGTTNIDSRLLATLAKKTTYPPLVYSNVIITTNLTFPLQAHRDTDVPDLGYHYDPIDVACYTVQISNCIVKMVPGTAVAVAGQYGVVLLGGAQLISQGAPDDLNRVVYYSVVQECSFTNWVPTWAGSCIMIWGPWTVTGLNPKVSLRFTELSVFRGGSQGDALLVNDESDLNVSFTDCQVHSGSIYQRLATLVITNCLLDRVDVFVADTEHGTIVSPIFRNSLFYGGTLHLEHMYEENWIVKDNLFDHTTMYIDGSSYDSDYNGYTTGSSLLNSSPNNVVADMTYQTGPLGRYYQPTNSGFIGMGSTTADLVGLYHYTTQTNQLKETNSIVDIGFHYVAVDMNGGPIDTDSDGVPDYLEDLNGNGSVNSGEADWQSAFDLGLKVLITNPRNGGTLP